MTDIVLALWRHIDPVTPSALVTSLIAASLHDADASTETNGWGEPWVFQDSPRRSVKGTERSSVVISNPGGWASPNRHNTDRFPRIQIEVFSDIDRNTVGHERLPERRSARGKATAIYNLLDPVLHRPYGGDTKWGDLRIVSSLRGGEPDYSEVPESDGVWRLLVSYNTEVG